MKCVRWSVSHSNVFEAFFFLSGLFEAGLLSVHACTAPSGYAIGPSAAQVFNTMDLKAVLAHSFGVHSAMIMSSTIPNTFGDLGCVLMGSFDVGQVNGFSYKSLVYTDLSEKNSMKKTYGKGMMVVIMYMFQKWAIPLPGQMTPCNRRGYTV